MQLRNKALAGIAVVVALAGCASQPQKKTVSETDKQRTQQQAFDQQLAYRNNLAAIQNSCKPQQSAGQVASEAPPAAAPTCNCSCTPEGSKSSVESGSSKASSASAKSSKKSLID